MIQSFFRFLLCISLVFLSQNLIAEDFHKLIEDENYVKVKSELKKRPDFVNMKDELGRFPIHLAVKSGDLRMVKLLIEAGAKLNVEDNLYHSTPLHYAAFYHYKKILRFLLARGAYINVADSNGNFPLHFAAGNGCLETIELLILHKASLNCLNKKLQTPLHLLAYGGKNKIEFPFSTNGASGYIDSAAALIKAGASDKIRDINDRTPAEVAFIARPYRGFAQKFSQALFNR